MRRYRSSKRKYINQKSRLRVRRGDTKNIKRRHKESISGAGVLLANKISSLRKKYIQHYRTCFGTF